MQLFKKKYSNTDLQLRTDKYGTQLVEMQNDVPPPRKNADGSVSHSMRFYAVKYPKYKIGDILWVRETWAKNEIGFVYKAKVCGNDKPINGWKPSIFMPKEAARFFLKVTGVRAERLQDISEADAIKEGVEPNPIFNNKCYRDYLWTKDPFPDAGQHCRSAKDSFMTLWEEINGFDSWEKNHWVFVYEFEKIAKPQNWPL